MRNILVVSFLLSLATGVQAQTALPVAQEECYDEPFTLQGHRYCWVTADNRMHPVKPTRHDVQLKVSFSLPFNDPTAAGFDPVPLFLDEHSNARQPDGWITSQSRQRTAGGGYTVGRSMGARLRLASDGVLVDLSWVRQPRVYAFTSTGVYASATRWDDGCSCWLGSAQEDIQLNQHDVTLHTFSGGMGYDVLHRFGFVSLELVGGAEVSVARHRKRVDHTRRLDWAAQQEIVQDLDETTWNGGNLVQPYVSVGADVYPFGKDRFVAFGVTTRFLPFEGRWGIGSGDQISPYEIPIRYRRWSTSFHASLVF